MRPRCLLFDSCRAQVTASRGAFKGRRIRLLRAVRVGYQVAPLWIAFARAEERAVDRSAPAVEALAGRDASKRRTILPPFPQLRVSHPSRSDADRTRASPSRRGGMRARSESASQGFRMMKLANRGAAKVSVVWTIGVMMAFLVAVVMFFLTSQQSTANLQRAEKAEKTAKAQEKQLEE